MQGQADRYGQTVTMKRLRSNGCDEAMTIKIKICGINDPATIPAADKADFVGINCYDKSPRYVPIHAIPGLIQTLTKPTVGVVVDASDALLGDILASGIQMIQVHGGESPARCAAIKKRFDGVPIIKALSIEQPGDVAKAFAAYRQVADILLFDAPPISDSPGGTGRKADWRALAQGLAQVAAPPLPWMLAGGLHAGNLEAALAMTEAPGVDTASGVEEKPGVKSIPKIDAFIARARQLQPINP